MLLITLIYFRNIYAFDFVYILYSFFYLVQINSYIGQPLYSCDIL